MLTTQLTSMQHHQKINMLADFMEMKVTQVQDGNETYIVVTGESGHYVQTPINMDVYDPYNDLNQAQSIIEKIESMDYGVKRCRTVVEIYIDSTKESIIRHKDPNRRRSLFDALVEFVSYYNNVELQQDAIVLKLNTKYWNKRVRAKLHPCWELYKTESGVYGVINTNHDEWLVVSLQTTDRAAAVTFLQLAGISFKTYIKN